MGRRKKNATIEQDLQSFTETKEESLRIFTREKITVPPKVIAMFDVQPVRKSNMIGGERLEHFNEGSYAESLKWAHQWRDNFNAKSKEFKIEFVNYYPQEFKGKSVLMGFNVVNVGE